MRIIIINESYINYLRKYDSKVEVNKNQTRPYVGIVLKIDKHQYFAPFSSVPKKRSKFATIDLYNKNDYTGSIQLNNMIPVSSDNIIDFDFKKEDEKYVYLINSQQKYINNNEILICSKAEKLYLAKINKTLPKKLESIVCDFKLLEEKCKEYNNQFIRENDLDKINSTIDKNYEKELHKEKKKKDNEIER